MTAPTRQPARCLTSLGAPARPGGTGRRNHRRLMCRASSQWLRQRRAPGRRPVPARVRTRRAAARRRGRRVQPPDRGCARRTGCTAVRQRLLSQLRRSAARVHGPARPGPAWPRYRAPATTAGASPSTCAAASRASAARRTGGWWPMPAGTAGSTRRGPSPVARCPSRGTGSTPANGQVRWYAAMSVRNRVMSSSSRVGRVSRTASR